MGMLRNSHQILQNVTKKSWQVLESRIATVRVFRVAERTERRASTIEQLIDRPTTGSGLNGCRRQSKTLPECPPFPVTGGGRIHTVGLYREVRLACRAQSGTVRAHTVSDRKLRNSLVTYRTIYTVFIHSSSSTNKSS